MVLCPVSRFQLTPSRFLFLVRVGVREYFGVSDNLCVREPKPFWDLLC